MRNFDDFWVGELIIFKKNLSGYTIFLVFREKSSYEATNAKPITRARKAYEKWGSPHQNHLRIEFRFYFSPANPHQK